MNQLLTNQILIGLCTLVSTLCWGLCFWWMHRIQRSQDTLLRELHAQGKRIERLSKEEHAMMSELKPAVSEIKEVMHAQSQENKAGEG